MKKIAIMTTFLIAAAQPSIAIGLPTHSECVELGMQYYKDIGSFPTLSTGEDALEKVIGMCTRSPIAFGTKE